MKEVRKVLRVRLCGDNNDVIEVFDWWEDLDLCAIQFGNWLDNEIDWGNGEIALSWSMARKLGEELIAMADLHEPEQ